MRARHIEEVADFALTLRLLGEKLEAGLDQDGLNYVETMEAAEVVVLSLLPLLVEAGPALAARAHHERLRISTSN